MIQFRCEAGRLSVYYQVRKERKAEPTKRSVFIRAVPLGLMAVVNFETLTFPPRIVARNADPFARRVTAAKSVVS